MVRKRAARLVAMVAIVALAMMVSAIPGVASARTMRAGGAAQAPVRHKVFRVQSSLVAAAADDDIPGVAKTLPFTVSDTLADLSDYDDVYSFNLNVGDRLVVTLEGPSNSTIVPFLYGPGTTTVDGSSEPVGSSGSDGPIQRFTYFADVAGTYYLDAYLMDGAGGSYTMSAGIGTTADDEIPGIASVLPLSATDALGTGTDVDDVYAVNLTAGQTLQVGLTGAAGTDFGTVLFEPGTTTVWGDSGAVEGSDNAGTSTESFFYTATTSGTHYILVYINDGSPSGAYTLSADAIVQMPTSITIKTSSTTARIGGVPVLSGSVTPQAMIGVNVVCYVKKPGKSYWSYSSNRTAYNLNGAAAWLYKYTFKKGMAKGVYTFKASAPAPGFPNSAPFLPSDSTSVKVTLK